MAVKKMTWKTLIKNKSTLSSLNAGSAIVSLLTNIDNKLKDLYQIAGYNSVSTIYARVMTQYFYKSTQTSLWDDMEIYLSSFKENDETILLSLAHKLTEYAGFYYKVLTDKGFAKKITIGRQYQDTSHTEGNNKNYNSETPQIELDNFEDAIKYASNLSKDENENDATRNGYSSISTEGKTFEEAVKNTRFLFFNELVDYIMNIPKIVYSYYALDSLPYPALVKNYMDTIKNCYEIENER